MATFLDDLTHWIAKNHPNFTQQFKEFLAADPQLNAFINDTFKELNVALSEFLSDKDVQAFLKDFSQGLNEMTSEVKGVWQELMQDPEVQSFIKDLSKEWQGAQHELKKGFKELSQDPFVQELFELYSDSIKDLKQAFNNSELANDFRKEYVNLMKAMDKEVLNHPDFKTAKKSLEKEMKTVNKHLKNAANDPQHAEKHLKKLNKDLEKFSKRIEKAIERKDGINQGKKYDFLSKVKRFFSNLGKRSQKQTVDMEVARNPPPSQPQTQQHIVQKPTEQHRPGTINFGFTQSKVDTKHLERDISSLINNDSHDIHTMGINPLMSDIEMSASQYQRLERQVERDRGAFARITDDFDKRMHENALKVQATDLITKYQVAMEKLKQLEGLQNKLPTTPENREKLQVTRDNIQSFQESLTNLQQWHSPLNMQQIADFRDECRGRFNEMNRKGIDKSDTSQLLKAQQTLENALSAETCLNNLDAPATMRLPDGGKKLSGTIERITKDRLSASRKRHP